MSERVIDEAAQWMMILQSGQASEADLQAFDTWLHNDARHAQVFRRFGESLEVMRQPALCGLRDEQVISALNAPSSRRNILRGGLGVLGLAGLSLLGLRLSEHGLALPGDLSTGVAERRGFALADGSRLTLDACSRVTPQFSPASRRLSLHQGSLLLAAAAGTVPLVVHSPAGRLQLGGGGRVLLDSRSAAPERLSVLADELLLETADGRRTRLTAGQSASFSASGLLSVDTAQAASGAWLDGLLEAENRSLGEVIETLRAYRHGVLRVSPEAAALRTSGLYPLDDSDRALRLLESTLPIVVNRYSAYWISIDRAV